MGEQVVLFSHIRCSVNTTGRKKKRNRKDELMLAAEGGCSLVLRANRNWSFRGLSVLAPVVSPMG